MTILALNNNFYGSYSSNQIFFEELIEAFISLGVNVLKANSIEDVEFIYENHKIDFSICFSKYFYYSDGIPLYEKYKVLNFQWISDNPLKMNIDLKSKWIRYIFIDDEYPILINKLPMFDCLFLPLGYLEKNKKIRNFKNGKILFPCKIRNLKNLQKQIEGSNYSKYINSFLDYYVRSDSFIVSLNTFFRENNIISHEAREEIFRKANEYVRIEKRLFVLNNIKGIPIDVLGEDNGNELSNEQINFLKPVDYRNTSELFGEYLMVVNVDPNYNSCFHDRFIRAVSSGTVCLTNENKKMIKLDSYNYSFSEPDSVMSAINKILENYDLVLKAEQDIIEQFSWEKSAARIINTYNIGKFRNEKFLDKYNKIIVIGSPGSGKTFFSNELGKIWDGNVYHIDDIFWENETEHLSYEVLEKKIDEIIREEKWIIDGTYLSILGKRVMSADCIVYLDLPSEVCVNSVIKRTDFTRKIHGTEDYAGFLEYIRNFKRHSGFLIDETLRNFPEKAIYRFFSRNEVNKFLKTLLEA